MVPADFCHATLPPPAETSTPTRGDADWEGEFAAHLDTAPFWKGFGVAMSSSPWEWLWNGDEDVASPFHARAVSRCARELEDFSFKFEAECADSPCRFRFRCRYRSRSRRVRQGQPTGFLVFSRRVAVATGRGARGDAGIAIGIGIGIGLHTLTRACSPAPEARQTIDPGVSPGSPDLPVRAPAGRQSPCLPSRTPAVPPAAGPSTAPSKCRHEASVDFIGGRANS